MKKKKRKKKGQGEEEEEEEEEEKKEKKKQTFVKTVRGLNGGWPNMLSDGDSVVVIVNNSSRRQTPVFQVCLWTSYNSEDIHPTTANLSCTPTTGAICMNSK